MVAQCSARQAEAVLGTNAGTYVPGMSLRSAGHTREALDLQWPMVKYQEDVPFRLINRFGASHKMASHEFRKSGMASRALNSFINSMSAIETHKFAAPGEYQEVDWLKPSRSLILHNIRVFHKKGFLA